MEHWSITQKDSYVCRLEKIITMKMSILHKRFNITPIRNNNDIKHESQNFYGATKNRWTISRQNKARNTMLPCFNIHYKTIQMTMREYVPPVRMLIIKKRRDNMSVKMWRKVTTFRLLVRMTISTAILENIMEVP